MRCCDSTSDCMRCRHMQIPRVLEHGTIIGRGNSLRPWRAKRVGQPILRNGEEGAHAGMLLDHCTLRSRGSAILVSENTIFSCP